MSDLDFNKYIGARIKKKRKELGISLNQLAELLKLSYQQVQKYESGSSKVSAEKLALISHIFSEPIDFFYKDIDFNSITIGSEVKPTVISGARQNNMQILLVEDSPNDAILFKEAAIKCDYVEDVEIEHNAASVFPTLLNHQKKPNHRLPDIIFLDINLPGGSGFDILKRLKSDHDLCHIPVIVISGSINWDDMMRAYQLSAACYILKSNRYSDLDETISKVVEFWTQRVILPNM